MFASLFTGVADRDRSTWKGRSGFSRSDSASNCQLLWQTQKKGRIVPNVLRLTTSEPSMFSTPAHRRRLHRGGDFCVELPVRLDPRELAAKRGRHRAQRRRVEEMRDLDLAAEPAFDQHRQIGGAERIAAEIEEIVLEREGLDPQDASPEFGERLFLGHFRRRARGGSVGSGDKRWQGEAVELAARQARQAVEKDHAARNF